MPKELNCSSLNDITSRTLAHYETYAAQFWEGTKDHDVTQNYQAFLDALPKRDGLRILDFGCGPGRDLLFFKNKGHVPTGLDGSASFCEMARKYSGCEVLHQDFLKLSLPSFHFDGIFANASLFHIPSQEFSRILRELRDSLRPEGILISSNPRGEGEGFSGERYGTYYEYDMYGALLENAGFKPLSHYYRPPGLPFHEQPWLVVVSQKAS
jgi:SAM-dependent methyltransferase